MSAEATGWVWKHSPYTGSKLVIHLAVADVVNDAHGNEFWMSQAGLAEKARVTRQSVCEWFRDAIDRGLVECVRDNSTAGKPNCYRLLMPTGVSPIVTGGVGKSDRGVSAMPTGGVGKSDTELKRTKEGTKTSLSLVEEVDENATESDSSFASSAKKVFDTWVEATGKDPKKAKLNRARTDKIRARLKEGYSVDDLCAAVRGIAMSAWHTGDNPDGKRYDDITVALRDGAQVEKFRDLCEQGGERGRRSAVDTVLEMFSNRGQSGKALSRALTEGSE
jgi:hypothetical protein